jgi:DNA-directed RNA polymerase specialized sigma subunit
MEALLGAGALGGSGVCVMTAKEYLSQFKTISIRLKSISQQIQAIDTALTSTTPILSKTPHSASPDPHRMENLIATKVDLEREGAAGAVRLGEIIQSVKSLPDALLVTILTNRYILFMDWREIMSELYISESHLHRLHSKALNEIEKMRAYESK